MTETADFALRLKDQVSRDAAAAAGSMAKVTAGFEQAKRAADIFNPSSHWRKTRSELDRVAKEQDKLHMSALKRDAADKRSAERAAEALTRRTDLLARQQRQDEFRQQRAAERAARMLARHEKAQRREREKREAGEDFRRDRQIEATGFGGANLTGIGAGIAAATALATAGLAAAYAIGRIAYEFGAATVAAAAFAQDSKLAIGALLGNAGAAETQFREVRFEAQALGLDVMGTVDQFRKLLSAQFDIGTAREIVRMSADLKVAGANVEKAILAISQIKMKGFLQGEELTGQLAEAGVSAELVYKRLEKQLGKTRKEILTMQKTGKIQADVAIEAIFGAVKDKTGVESFGELAKQRADTTLSGIAAKAMAAFQNRIITAGEAIAPLITPIFQRVGGLAEKLLGNRKAELFGDRVLEALQRLGAWTDANWPRIEAFVVGGFETAVYWAGELFDAGEYLVENWDFIATSFEGGAFWLKMFAISAGFVAAPLIAISALAFGAAAAVVWLTGKLVQAIDTAAEFVAMLGAAGQLVNLAQFGPTGIAGGVGAMLAGDALGNKIAPKVTTPQLQTVLASPRVSPENVQGALSRTTNVGGISMPINVAGIDIGSDPEQAGGAIGQQVTRAMSNFFENLED
jgi:tape measure domain-containing protein